MNTVYVVMAWRGGQDDHEAWPVRVFGSKAQAEAFEAEAESARVAAFKGRDARTWLYEVGAINSYFMDIQRWTGDEVEGFDVCPVPMSGPVEVDSN